MIVPKRIAIWWDASLSQNLKIKFPELYHRKISLVTELARSIMPAVFDIYAFRNTQDRPISIKVTQSDSLSAIEKALNDITYDGATNFLHLNFNPPGYTYSFHLLFSDGICTLHRYFHVVLVHSLRVVRKKHPNFPLFLYSQLVLPLTRVLFPTIF